MITVLCIWQSGTDFDYYPYVSRLRNMVFRHLSRPHEFVCITDCPDYVDCRTIDIKYSFPGKWCKMEMWRPDLSVRGNRVLFLDLDEVVVNTLDPLLDLEGDLILTQCAYNYNAKNPRRIARYSSAVVLYDSPNVRPQIWNGFDRKCVPERFVGDQDYVGFLCPNEGTFPEKWVYKYRKERHQRAPETEASVMSFASTKPHQVENELSWVSQYWK